MFHDSPHALAYMESHVAPIVQTDRLSPSTLDKPCDHVAYQSCIEVAGMERLERVRVGIFHQDSFTCEYPWCAHTQRLQQRRVRQPDIQKTRPGYRYLGNLISQRFPQFVRDGFSYFARILLQPACQLHSHVGSIIAELFIRTRQRHCLILNIKQFSTYRLHGKHDFLLHGSYYTDMPTEVRDNSLFSRLQQPAGLPYHSIKHYQQHKEWRHYLQN